MQDCHYLPQSWYVASHVDAAWMSRVWVDKDLTDVLSHQKTTPTTMADAQSCNFVLRYPHLQDDLAVLTKFAGTDMALPNRKHRHYSERCPTALSKETLDLVREIYDEDFTRFGFAREWAELPKAD